MALDTPLNHRQVEVLRWINDGCPEGRWTDFTYKTTASALQSRRLVGISKRGGKWMATILPAGVAYLANGQYPSGHWTKKRGAVAVDLDFGATTSLEQAASTWQPPPPRAPKPPPPDGVTPTRKLLKDVIDADGILERDTRDDDTNYRTLVGIINRRQMAPDGQEVIMLTGRSYHHLRFRLSSVSDWKTTSPGETMAAERVPRWHPTVASLRSDKRLSSIDKSSRDRGFRLLHALAREGEARGHAVRVPRRNVQGYTEDPSKLGGDLIFKVESIECSVCIRQPQDRVPHTPTKQELERAKQYSWSRPPTYDYVPAGWLSITIDTNSRWSSKVTWAEKTGPRLESRLPDVMTTFERWAVVDVERREAEGRAEIEKRVRHQRQDELAREAYVQHALGVRLIADLEAWELTARLGLYVAKLRERVDVMTDAIERDAATE